ncbi:pentapeptide repeat-containing protein [Pseudovibrio ascidiaceicola]|uniref:pentapeptide repeat-containing protein n=1 Tax=Pseudovibrio ascidiaceicola TaxID=285279 RepID=UPI000D69F22A|nr:pentapeptide repeat-containing protein [Pseudovibrio ascidiaceicola]
MSKYRTYSKKAYGRRQFVRATTNNDVVEGRVSRFLKAFRRRHANLIWALEVVGVLVAVGAVMFDFSWRWTIERPAIEEERAARNRDRIAAAWGLLNSQLQGNIGKGEALSTIVSLAGSFPSGLQLSCKLQDKQTCYRTAVVSDLVIKKDKPDQGRIDHLSIERVFLAKARFEEAIFFNLRSAGANWSDVLVKNSILKDIDLSDAVMRQLVVQGTIETSNKEKAFSIELRSHGFDILNAQGASFLKSTFENIDISMGNFLGATFLSDNSFKNSNISATSFLGAHLSGTEWVQTNLKDVEISKANFCVINKAKGRFFFGRTSEVPRCAKIDNEEMFRGAYFFEGMPPTGLKETAKQNRLNWQAMKRLIMVCPEPDQDIGLKITHPTFLSDFKFFKINPRCRSWSVYDE